MLAFQVVKFSVKRSSTVETKRSALILSYLFLFVILVVGLNDHFTRFGTFFLAFVNKLDNSFFEDAHAQNLRTIQDTRILFIVMVSMLSKLQEINLLRCIKPHNITIYNITASSQGINTIV